MERRENKKIHNQKGFTLLEILVVLTIMGFLIAMVAPRLAGISGDAVDTVCDTNQNRMVTYMASYFEKTNKFPDKLTNLVDRTDGGTDFSAAEYQIPAVSDGNPDTGAETLAAEFNDRNHFHIHYLDTAEQIALKAMGISTLLNLNAYDAYKNDENGTINEATDAYIAPNDVALEGDVAQSPAMEEVGVAVDADRDGILDNVIAVAMVGLGETATAGTWDASDEEQGWGEPDFFGRIVLGMGPECSLVTSGVIGNAAHCPGGIQNAENVTYNDYNLVLPRLGDTVAKAGYPLTDVTAIAYGEDDVMTGYVVADNTANLKVRTFSVDEGQESWQFATMCPEGHMYPADDGDFWAVDLGTTAGTID